MDPGPVGLPMNTLPLWDRDAGEDSAASGLPESARRAIEGAIRSFDTHVKLPFTSDMVRGRLSLAVLDVLARHPCALGAAFTAFARRGEIEETGQRVTTQRRAGRTRRLTVWRFR